MSSMLQNYNIFFETNISFLPFLVPFDYEKYGKNSYFGQLFHIDDGKDYIGIVFGARIVVGEVQIEPIVAVFV